MLIHNLLSTVLILASLGYFLKIKRFLPAGTFYIPWFIVSSSVTFLYILGLFGLLRVGICFIDIIGLYFLVDVFFKKKPNRGYLSRFKFNKVTIKTWGFNALILAVIFHIINLVPPNYKFTTWDEFPSWGLNSKLLWLNKGFWTQKDFNFFKTYPPGEQIFHFLFSTHFTWTEANVLKSQILWVLLCFLAIASTVLRKNLITGTIFLISTPTLYYLCGFTFGNIMADGLLALQFAAIMAFTIETKGIRHQTYYILATVIPLIIIKPNGFVLLIPIFLLQFHKAKEIKNVITVGINRKVNSQANLNRRIAQKTLIKRAKTYQYLLIPLIGIFTTASWTGFLRFHHIAPTQVPPHFNWLLDSKFEKFRYEVGISILNDLTKPVSEFSGIHSFGWFGSANLIEIFSVLLAIELFGYIFIRKMNSNILIFFPTPWALGLFAYIFGLYLSYILVSTQADALQTSSFFRYVNVYLFAWLISILSRLLISIGSFDAFSSFMLAALISLICLNISPATLKNDMKGIRSDGKSLSSRVNVEAFMNRYSTPALRSKLYFINQDSTGYEKYIFSYLNPRNETNWWCWSLGKKYYKKDQWTCDSKLSDVLRGYDYLYIFKGDAKLFADNKEVFPLNFSGYSDFQGKFRINYRADTELTLVPSS